MAPSVLIVYASVYGQAELIARRIAEASTDWGVSTVVSDIRKVTPADLTHFDTALFVASVQLGRHTRGITAFARKNRPRLSLMRTAFISVSGDAGYRSTVSRAEACARKFFAATGWTPAEWTVAGGALRFTRYNPLLRFLIKRIHSAQGGTALDSHRDYELTDWEAVMRFGKAFLTSHHEVRVA
jgi:menaquinone-dependent protoporphyrinogen oxidase